MNHPEVPAFGRESFKHEIKTLAENIAFDDKYELNTQSGTQWDGFRHVGSALNSEDRVGNLMKAFSRLPGYLPKPSTTIPTMKILSVPKRITNAPSTTGQITASQVAVSSSTTVLTPTRKVSL